MAEKKRVKIKSKKENEKNEIKIKYNPVSRSKTFIDHHHHQHPPLHQPHHILFFFFVHPLLNSSSFFSFEGEKCTVKVWIFIFKLTSKMLLPPQKICATYALTKIFTPFFYLDVPVVVVAKFITYTYLFHDIYWRRRRRRTINPKRISSSSS